MAFFDNKGRNLSDAQLSAIHAKAGNRGISEKQLNKTALTSLNDEMRAEQSRREKDYNKAVDNALNKVYRLPPPKPTKVEKVKEVKKEIKELKELKEESISKKAESKLSDIAIRRMLDKQEEKQKKLEKNQKKIIEIGNLRDERADLLQKQLDNTEKQAPTGAVIETVSEPPLTTPGLIAGTDPMKFRREQSVEDKIRRVALDLEIEQGFSPQEAMDRAKRQVVAQELG